MLGKMSTMPRTAIPRTKKTVTRVKPAVPARARKRAVAPVKVAANEPVAALAHDVQERTLPVRSQQCALAVASCSKASKA
jgi:hypothetical protein